MDFGKCGNWMHVCMKAMKNGSQLGPHKLLFRPQCEEFWQFEFSLVEKLLLGNGKKTIYRMDKRRKRLLCKSSISSRVHRGLCVAHTSLFHELKTLSGLISVPGEVRTPLFFCLVSLTWPVSLWDRWARGMCVCVYVQRSDTPHSAGVLLSSAADLHLIVWPCSKTQSFPTFISRCPTWQLHTRFSSEWTIFCSIFMFVLSFWLCMAVIWGDYSNYFVYLVRKNNNSKIPFILKWCYIAYFK